MDRPRRYNIRRVVNEARRLLEEEIAARLRYYGIRADGSGVDPARLTHLSHADREVRRRLDQAIAKEQVGGLTRKQAVARYIRHVGFTYLNRFAALRAMEMRGLIKETVVPRPQYGGRSLRERDIAQANPNLSAAEVLRASLEEAFREVGREIALLFDADDEYSLVFPETRTCRRLIRLLSEEIPEEDWHEDEIIGWIYQYYNEEARKEFKKSRRKPTADDIPVINQFYTPHWVVRVLTDNTLGRLWLEMRGRCPRLVDENGQRRLDDPRIGVPDPKTDPETFAAWLRDPQSAVQDPKSEVQDLVDTFCSYLVPLKNEPPPREKKRAREIKVLDPAVGSGHFLIYAFDVLYRIYREDEPDTPPEEIPALILEHNLFGIDIDLRAVQLAALSLYLKAKSYNPRMKVRRMNLVVADARIADGRQRAEFLRRFATDKALQRLFARLFEDLNNTNELGSLLKVREPFEALLAQRQAQAEPPPGQQAFGGMKGQLDFGDAMMPAPPQRTIEDMLEELRRFEREAMEARDMGTLLFATEAEKSVGLLALLSQKYDVVLMNPPYGDMSVQAKRYLSSAYPDTKGDVYAAFMEQGIELTQLAGYVGALTYRSFMYLPTFSKMREGILCNQAALRIVADLYYGVLDEAAVEAAATVLQISPVSGEDICLFMNFTDGESEAKRIFFEEVLLCLVVGQNPSRAFPVPLSEFAKVPTSPFVYEASQTLRAVFQRYPPIDKDNARQPSAPKMADVKDGLSPGGKERFIRLYWECSIQSLGKGRDWVPHIKRATYSWYYVDFPEVVFWRNDGEEVKRNPDARPQNELFYYRPGICYSNVNVKGFTAKLMPKDAIFSTVAQAVIPIKPSHAPALLAFLNSKLSLFLLKTIGAIRHYNVGQVARLPAHPGIFIAQIGSWAQEAHDLKREWDTGNEVSTIFIKPWLLQVLDGFNPEERPITGHPFAKQFEWADWPSLHAIRAVRGSRDMSLRELAALCVQRKEMTDARVEELQRLIDEEVYRIYEISDEDRALIERELALRRGETPEATDGTEKEERTGEETFDIEAVADAEERIKDHVQRLLSFYVRQAIEADEDGIVPLDESFPDNLVDRVRACIARDFGPDQVARREQEIYEILGKSLAEWLARDYFEFHVNFYKRRPIFWQLTSYRLGRGRRAPGAFSCFLHYHRLTRDTLPKVQAFYLAGVKERAEREREYLFRELEAARTAGDRRRVRRLTKEYEAAVARVEELERFDRALTTVHNPRPDPYPLPANPRWVHRAIAEVRDNGWTPILDHGVRVNIEPLKEAGLLPKEADRVK
jgi:hypothetical protein